MAVAGGVTATVVTLALLWLLLRMTSRGASTTSGRYIGGVIETSAESSWTPGLDRSFNRLIEESGLPLGATAGMLLILALSLAVAGGIYVAFENVLWAGAAIPLVICLLILLFMGLQARQAKLVQDALPRVVEMLARSVRAGESLEQALFSVAQSTPGPLGVSFRRAAQQIDLGLPIGTALAQLQQRHRSLDVRMVVGALVVHRQTGGDLPSTLERLAMVTRERLTYRRQLQAATAAARAAALCVGLITPFIFLYFLNQERYAERMLNDPSGQFFIILAAGLEVVGIGWLLLLSRSEV